MNRSPAIRNPCFAHLRLRPDESVVVAYQIVRPQTPEQDFPALLTSAVDVRRWIQSRRTGLDLGQVDISVTRTQEPWIAHDVRVAHHHIRGHVVRLGTQFVRDQGADRGVDDRPARLAARVHQVRGRTVLAVQVMTDRAEERATVHAVGQSGEVLTKLDVPSGRGNRVIVGARDVLAVAPSLGIERVDVTGTAAQPNVYARIRPTVGRLVRCRNS